MARPAKYFCEPGDDPVDRMEATIKPREEWSEIFRQASRYERDLFFDSNMDGMDWERVTDHYASLLPLIGSRDDLNYILTEMLGELGSSHIFLYGAEDLSPAVAKASLLGADYTVIRTLEDTASQPSIPGTTPGRIIGRRSQLQNRLLKPANSCWQSTGKK